MQDAVPDPDDPGFDPHARRISSRAGRWALGLGLVGTLFSLIGGVLLAVPAVVLAIVSLRAPDRTRGPAIAGLALGLFTILATTLFVTSPLWLGGGVEVTFQWPSFGTPAPTASP